MSNDLPCGWHKQLWFAPWIEFPIKIGAVVDVEKGVIQVRNGLGMEMEVLPLNVMNMLQVLKRFEEEKCKI